MKFLPTSFPSVIHRIAVVIGLLYSVFISVFAIDVFNSGVDLLEAMANFLVQLIPGVMVAVLVIWSFFRPFYASLVMIGTGLLSIWMLNTGANLINFLLISAPIIVSGILVFIAWGTDYVMKNRSDTTPLSDISDRFLS